MSEQKFATLDLLPCKEFIITLKDGTIIKGKYGLWAVKRFCDKRGLTLMELHERMKPEHTTFDDLCQVILCAVEYTQREENKPFIYSDFHVCNWIEELGGMTSENYARLQAHAASTDEPVDEKKNQGQSPGANLSEPVTEPG